jgi:hypothetical protein
MSTAIYLNDHPQHSSCNECCAKWWKTALAISACIIGLLVMAYGACGLTPLAHTSSILSPLSHLSAAAKIGIILGGCAVSVAGILTVILLQKSKPNRIKQAHEPAPQDPSNTGLLQTGPSVSISAHSSLSGLVHQAMPATPHAEPPIHLELKPNATHVQTSHTAPAENVLSPSNDSSVKHQPVLVSKTDLKQIIAPKGGEMFTKIISTWVKDAALHIFSDPLRSFLEIIVNALDATYPDQAVGQFGNDLSFRSQPRNLSFKNRSLQW